MFRHGLVFGVLLAGCGDAGSNEEQGATGASAGAGASEGGADGGAGGSTGGTGAASAGGSGAGEPGGQGGGAGSPTDPCLDVTVSCPVAPGSITSGSGFVAIDRCAFPLLEEGFVEGSNAIAALAGALPHRTIADVLSDLNRAATTEASVPGSPAGLSQAFGWNSGDQDVAYWIPQGLTGSADAAAGGLVEGREVVLASWYYDADSDPGSTFEKGVRVSLADVTNPISVSYRHLLLVEPKMVAGEVDFDPVVIHAGGIVWLGDYLYVADTVHGFRVFDMAQILEVETGKDIIGKDLDDQLLYAANYKYIVPQVGRYERQGSCDPRFSFVALDRTTSPPTLVSGEYDATSLHGRLFHWPLEENGRLAPSTSFPSSAFISAHSHLQGAVSAGPKHWLSSSEPPAGKGDLYVAGEATQSLTMSWIDAPEDLVLDLPRNKLWGLSEGTGARYVFAVSPPP